MCYHRRVCFFFIFFFFFFYIHYKKLLFCYIFVVNHGKKHMWGGSRVCYVCLFVILLHCYIMTLLYPYSRQVSISFGVHNGITVAKHPCVSPLAFHHAMVKNIPKPKIDLARNLKWHGFYFGMPIALTSHEQSAHSNSGKHLTIAQRNTLTCQALA